MTAPKVSVCVPVYNGERYLAAALKSALAQTERDIEVLVVDNASTDASPEIIARFSDPRLRVVRNPVTLTMAENFSRALAFARGEYVAFLCADDAWAPGFLERMARRLDERPDCAYAFAAFREIDAAGTPGALIRPYPEDAVFLARERFARHLKHNDVYLVAALGRRAAIEKAGGVDAGVPYWFDSDLWIRLERGGAGTAYVAEPLSFYRRHAQMGSLEIAGRRGRQWPGVFYRILRKNLRHPEATALLGAEGLRAAADDCVGFFLSSVAYHAVDCLKKREFVEFVVYAGEWSRWAARSIFDFGPGPLWRSVSGAAGRRLGLLSRS